MLYVFQIFIQTQHNYNYLSLI